MEAPKLNEIWQVQWQQGGQGKVNNILVRIDEDKKEFNPPNWRRNDFKCDHHGSQLIVSGNNFLERWMSAEDFENTPILKNDLSDIAKTNNH